MAPKLCVFTFAHMYATIEVYFDHRPLHPLTHIQKSVARKGVFII